MWQKVWIVPGAATLNQKSAGYEYEHPLPPGIEVRREDWFGHLSDCSMRVMCEIDHLALEKRSEGARLGAGPDDPFHEQALKIFREIILPSLVEDVNTGNHFAPLRQVHYAVALAKWYREEIVAHGFHTRLMELAEKTRTSLGHSTEIGPGPDAPEWMNECYARYLELLDGVFRVAQPEANVNGITRFRIYHSGCVSI